MPMVFRFLVLLSAGVLALLATLAAGWSMGRSAGLAPWLPAAPALVMAEARQQVRDRAGVVAPDLVARVDQAGRYDPFAAEPFLVAALARPSQGRLGVRLLLLEAARRRNPRNREVRAFLLDEYLRLGDAAAAIGEITVLLRLVPGSERVLLPVLTRLVAEPETRPQALSALTADPLRPPLLRDLAGANASPLLIQALTPDLVGAARREAEGQWLPGVIDPYVARGDVAAAWQLWAHFNAAPASGTGLLRDPDFAGRFGPPFGWALASGEAGLVEGEGKALRVTDYGRSSWTPARQLLRLGAGTYRLAFAMPLAAGEAPALLWQIDCVGKGGRLLDYPVAPGGPFADTNPARFAVPAQDCPGQWLSLVIRAAEFRRTRSAAIGPVRLIPEGRP